MITNAFSDADFFTCDDDAEVFSHTCPGDAIGEYVDERVLVTWDAAGKPVVEPATVTVYAYTRKVLDAAKVKPWWGRDVLEHFIEWLDEEYGNPEETTDPTDEMLALAKKFVEDVAALYPVYQCERVGEETVELLPWIQENEPGLLEQEETP